MEKVVKENSLFDEKFFQIEVVGDIAIIRQLLPGLPPKVLWSGLKSDIIDKLSDLMR